MKALASVVWDAFSLGRRDAVARDIAKIVAHASKSFGTPTVNQWVYRRGSLVSTLECLFCRHVLCALRSGRTADRFSTCIIPWDAEAPEPHGERCAAGVVAGLVEPKEPSPIDRVKYAGALATGFEMSPHEAIADNCIDNITIYGHGFRRAKHIAVYFGDQAARIRRVKNDRELHIYSPQTYDWGHRPVWVTLDDVTSLLRERFYYHPISPY